MKWYNIDLRTQRVIDAEYVIDILLKMQSDFVPKWLCQYLDIPLFLESLILFLQVRWDLIYTRRNVGLMVRFGVAFQF